MKMYLAFKKKTDSGKTPGGYEFIKRTWYEPFGLFFSKEAAAMSEDDARTIEFDIGSGEIDLFRDDLIEANSSIDDALLRGKDVIDRLEKMKIPPGETGVIKRFAEDLDSYVLRGVPLVDTPADKPAD